MNRILLFLAIVTVSACRFHGRTITASGDVVKEQRNVNGFHGVDAAGPMDITIKQSSSFRVTVEAEQNLMPYIITRREGDKLEVKFRDNINVRNSSGVKVFVEMPEVYSIDLAGTGNVRSDGRIESDRKIDVDLAGSGNIELDVKSPDVSLSVAGVGKSTLKGETRRLDISIGGSGDVDARDLKSEDAEVSIGGSGNVQLFASMNLDLNIAGSGDITYYGNPLIKQSIVGSGTIKKGD